MTLQINIKGDLEQIKAKIPYQEVKMTFQKSYGPQDFIFEVLYTNANKKLQYEYLVKWKESGRVQEKSLNTKEAVRLFLLNFVEKNGTLKNKSLVTSHVEEISKIKDIDGYLLDNYFNGDQSNEKIEKGYQATQVNGVTVIQSKKIDISDLDTERQRKINKGMIILESLLDGDRDFSFSKIEQELVNDYLRRYFHKVGEEFEFGGGINSENTDSKSIEGFYGLLKRDCEYYVYMKDVSRDSLNKIETYGDKIKQLLAEELENEEDEKEYCSYCKKEMYWNHDKDRMMCPDKNCEFHVWN